jgi:hypothetical protein
VPGELKADAFQSQPLTAAALNRSWLDARQLKQPQNAVADNAIIIIIAYVHSSASPTRSLKRPRDYPKPPNIEF